MLAECFEMVKASEGVAEEIARSLDGIGPDAWPVETELADQLSRETAAMPEDFADECTMSYERFAEDAASFDIPL